MTRTSNGAPSPAAAGDKQQFGPTEQEAGELASIERDLAANHKTLDTLNRRYRNDPGTADRATKPYYDTITRLEARKDNILGAIATRQRDYDTTQASLGAAEAERTRVAEQPFREAFPNAYRALPLAGWSTAGAGGATATRGRVPSKSHSR